MNKSELIASVANHGDLDKATATKVINALLETIAARTEGGS
ncbi:histone-like protein [Azotobacter vinelandii CA]|uniref:Histone-like protein n=2 Tax=Azotobacter vinelandii TaxID=354 RepID=C1DDT8_AZOVD|nr:histone-like protein [Azotobacter vinelandii DJ]AGK15150.1 histone-like protein [Azotobacter vinelandii CA]AGK20215.1 histone-like protein [Azotobacter vinelandii CA6]SFY06971.1 DNA-binding protein HU-beta [Azotobacter vinelandii]